MASSAAPVESITSDPVIVVASDAQKVIPKTQVVEDAVENENNEPIRGRIIEEPLETRRVSTYERPIEIRYNRSRSPIYNRVPCNDYPVLTNTAALNTILEETDTCAETIYRQIVYITNHAFHSRDLEKSSWLFLIGIQDTWVKKPTTTFLTSHGFQFSMPNRGRDYYNDLGDDRYNRCATPIIRLGSALKVFKDDNEKSGTKKVKFLTAVQGTSNGGWVKLLVSYTRQGAMVDIFHEILNNHAIVFVGAVLQDTVIPVENPNRLPGVQFQRVGSVKELEEVGKGVIGVVC